ncbi:MAG TPA: hypothetical protein ENJ79_05260 [Gammaproteobacteria bacterium]|nr:hypothetical protein [Gammaproteobacteria bacterium]
MSQPAASEQVQPLDETRDAFSFWVGDTLFALELRNVLSIEQDANEIHPDPFSGQGALGVVRHRGVPVRVFDFAGFLGIESCGQQKEALINTLSAREQDHIDWLDSLENAIRNDEPFTKARNPHQCAFGKWRDSFRSRDEELMNILAQFDAPHRRIHSLADRLLNMNDAGQRDEALRALELERVTTLAELRRLFEHARSQIRDSIRSVLLFVTLDGKEPRLALRLNEISDMVSFQPGNIAATHSLGIPAQERLARVFQGYIQAGGNQDCLLLDIEGLIESTCHL